MSVARRRELVGSRTHVMTVQAQYICTASVDWHALSTSLVCSKVPASRLQGYFEDCIHGRKPRRAWTLHLQRGEHVWYFRIGCENLLVVPSTP